MKIWYFFLIADNLSILRMQSAYSKEATSCGKLTKNLIDVKVSYYQILNSRGILGTQIAY